MLAMTDVLPDCLAEVTTFLTSHPGAVVLGYSGGLDSSLLLHALVRAGARDRLRVVHVHHGLNAQADQWLQHCRRQCDALELELMVERVQLQPDGNVEARARQLRRDALMRHVGEGDALWLAQHLDDQAETLLLRLLRGAGSRGLGGMAARRLWQGKLLLRPLLSVSRQQLQQLAADWQLQWVEDDSNQQSQFDRNFLRLEILPRLAGRWPAVARRLAAAGSQLREDAELLDELASLDLARCDAVDDQLSLPAFVRLSAARQRNALRRWVTGQGLLPPSAVVLQRVLDEVLTAAHDREPQVVWPEAVFTRFRDRLYLLPATALAAPPADQLWLPDQQPHLEWGNWRLELQPEQLPGALRLPRGALSVRSARGGERLLWQGMHRQVSELWRVAAVPPWQRRQLPLLYCEDRLVAAAAIGAADDAAPDPAAPVWNIRVQAR